MFCDVIIDPDHPLTNYKLLDDIMLELAGNLKIQQMQAILAKEWKQYMENLEILYTDATCYESEMRYPTDQKLLWEGIKKSYETMCELSSRLGIHRSRTKFLDVQTANLTYRKQRKHSKSQTKKTEILYIFFGIHTANVVQLADSIVQREQLEGCLKRKRAHKRCFCIGATPRSQTIDEQPSLATGNDDKEANFKRLNTENGWTGRSLGQIKSIN